MALAQGDIVIIGLDAESWDRFAILATTDLAEGEVVRFTTSNWDTANGDFVDEANYIEWTVPVGGLAAGETVVFSERYGSTWHTGTPASLYSNSFGSPTEVGEVNIFGETNGITNEELFVFQGPPGNPTVISGLVTNDSSTAIPPGLNSTNGLVNVTGNNTDTVDLAEYSGISTGTRAEILAAVGDSANWGHEGGSTYNGGTNAVGAGETDLLDGFDLLNTTFDIICFTPGTLISTVTGQRPVQDLQVGDLVVTADNGLQAVRWIGRKHLTGARLFAFPELRPIKILAGSLGNDLPERDMWVSPQHRMLLNEPVLNTRFGEPEMLTPAKGMCNANGVFVDRTCVRIDYIHILFEQHEIIFANGVKTESFHPGDRSVKGLTHTARQELFEIFPELKANPKMFGPSVRPTLSVSEMQMFVQAKTGHQPPVLQMMRAL